MGNRTFKVFILIYIGIAFLRLLKEFGINIFGYIWDGATKIAYSIGLLPLEAADGFAGTETLIILMVLIWPLAVVIGVTQIIKSRKASRELYEKEMGISGEK